MLPVILGAAAIAVAAVLLVWTLLGAASSPTATRNLTAGMPLSTDLHDVMLPRSATERALQPAVSWLAARIRRITPAGRLDQIERRIVLAGVSHTWTLERILAAKVALGAAGTAFGVWRLVHAPGPWSLVIAAVVPTIAFFVPDLLLIDAAQKRQEAVRCALPDAIDQLAITVEAGLAFESAVARTSRSVNGPLAVELMRMLQDVQAGMTRSEALRGVAQRVDVPELRTFVSAVLQAERYGVPISQVLRVQSAELRLKRSQRAEERAAKLPVKLLLPTTFLIFPVLFIVLLGPAVIQMGRSF